MVDRLAQVGGSFAPPITAAMLESEWPALIAGTTGLTRTCLEQLHRLATTHREFPSNDARQMAKGIPHQSGRGQIVPLTDEAVDSCAPHLPDAAERKIMSDLFEALPTGPIRNAAFHLLWYANELALGREPITSDKL